VNDKKVILLVEGNPDDELMTLRVLERAGIKNEVVVARDGEEALAYLSVADAYTQGDTNRAVQLVLLEPKLPKVDGLNVLKRLRAQQPTADLPVAVFVSSEEEQHWLEGNGTGNIVCIPKPFNFDHLSQMVRQLGLSCADLHAHREGAK
jgi:two-component system, response regulator